MMISRFQGNYRFLSNFYEYPVWVTVMDEPLFPSGEHAFQALKATNLADVQRVLRSGSPGEAKKAGRSIAIRPDWEAVKRQCMLRVALAKFSDPALRDRLAATGNEVLVEGNTWGDRYWGAMQGGAPPMWHWGAGWYGQNWLGRILMMVRDVIA